MPNSFCTVWRRVLVAAALASAISAYAQSNSLDVTTYLYDNGRDGWNNQETVLNRDNVDTATFGKLGSYVFEGAVDAQPLYLHALNINGTPHNVLYAATEWNNVYARDPDSGALLWKVSLTPPGETIGYMPSGCYPSSYGVSSTPVIDRNLGLLFAVAMTRDSSGNYHHRLHAISIYTGQEASGSPKEITATYPGNGVGSVNGVQTFTPADHAAQAGLLLMSGTLYIGWTTPCPSSTTSGWIMAYSENDLHQISALDLAPNTTVAGPSAVITNYLTGDSSNNVYFYAGGGAIDSTFDTNGFPAGGDYGSSYLKMALVNGQLTPMDYYNTLKQAYGSGEVMLLPDQNDASGNVRHLLFAPYYYPSFVLDRDNMGKYDPTQSHAYEIVNQGAEGSSLYFNGDIDFPIQVPGNTGPTLAAFSFQQALVDPSPNDEAAIINPSTISPVATSANHINAIVWSLKLTSNGRLYAFDAHNLKRVLYRSDDAPNHRDFLGEMNLNAQNIPLAIDGKVFVTTAKGVAVFGLLQ